MKKTKALLLGIVFTAASCLPQILGNDLRAESPRFDTPSDTTSFVVSNDNTDYPEGGYDAKTNTWTSGVVTDRHSNRYADDFSENYNGVGLSMLAGSKNIDYAVTVGEEIKKGLAGQGIPFEYFITVRGEKGFGASVYNNGSPSADEFEVEKVYIRVRNAAYQYKKEAPQVQASTPPVSSLE